MVWDLDDILHVAGGSRRSPQLIEVGRALNKGRPATVGYFWSNGRIGATVGAGWVKIDRRFGVQGRGLQLDVPTLALLAKACRTWVRQRDRWAAFFSSSGGYPPGYGGHASYYLPPGKDSARVTVGRVGCLGHDRVGEELVGRDEVVVLPRPRRAGRLRIVAELWRRGEKHGPPEGSRVGVRFQLAEGVYLDAKRNDARAHDAHGGQVTLERGDEAFVRELLVAVRRCRGVGAVAYAAKMGDHR